VRSISEAIEKSHKDLLSTAFSNFDKNESEGSKLFQKMRDEDNTKKRSEKALEMLQSEHQYVDQLNNVVTNFVKPMREVATTHYPILSESQVNALFSTLEAIHKAHSNFLQRMTPRVNSWDTSSMMGDIFLELVVDSFKLYEKYVAEYTPNVETIEGLMISSVHFATFLVQKEREGKMSLTEVMGIPLKMLPKYYLDLEEFSSFTGENHPDYEKLKVVIVRFSEHLAKEQMNKKELIRGFSAKGLQVQQPQRKSSSSNAFPPSPTQGTKSSPPSSISGKTKATKPKK